MGFIKNAIIGIALYEGIKYLMKNDVFASKKFDELISGTVAPAKPFREEEIDVRKGARQTDQLDYLRENAIKDAGNDPWKNSLANDDLRAPDS